MEEIYTTTPKASALEDRFKCYTAGVQYGFHRAVDPTTCPPISEKIVGTSINIFEHGLRLGFLEGFRRTQQR